MTKSNLRKLQEQYDRAKAKQRTNQSFSFKPASTIHQIYNLYKDRRVFVAVPVVTYLGHEVYFRTLTFKDTALETLSVGLLALGLHFALRRFLERRKKAIPQALVLATSTISKWHIGGWFAVDFAGSLTGVGLLSALVVAWKLYWYSRRPAKAVYISGAQKLTIAKVAKLQQQKNAELIAKGAKPEYVDFIGLPIISVDATTGFLIFGETRAGKTILFTALMKILRYPDKNAVIFDPSGNMISTLLALGIDPKRFIIANPFHRDCYEWNFGKTFTNPAVAKVFFTNVMRSAKAQSKLENPSSSDSFFEIEAAELTTGVTMTLRRLALDAEKEPLFGLKELCYICTNKQRLTTTLQTYPDIWEEVEDIAGGNDQNAAVFGTLKQVFKSLQPLAECYYRARLLGRSFDLEDFTNSDKILILGRNERLGGCYLDYFNGAVSQYIITTRLGTPTSNETKPIKTMFVFDEFDKMGKINKLPNISTEGGKYGMCLVAATQSLRAIKGGYGDDDTARIISSITHLAFLKVGESDTDKFASEHFGKQIVNEPTTTLAKDHKGVLRRSVTWAEKPKPLFELGHFSSQKKMKDTGLLGVTIDCDGMYYTMNISKKMIGEMLPPEPTAAMQREDDKPQDNETTIFKPLTNTHLQELGLHSLINSKQQPAYEEQDTQRTITLNLDAFDFTDLDNDHDSDMDLGE